MERDYTFFAALEGAINFNSHAHVERDGTISAFVTEPVISTHTLTWSVTEVSENNITQTVFQLTRSRGA